MSRNAAGTRPNRRCAILLVVAMVGLAFVCMLPTGSIVWATPLQSPLRQTIPTLTPTPIPSWIWVGRAGGNPADYAPSGMPDFDQHQGNWYAAAQPETWTHCGPLAFADVLWWLDSSFEPHSTPPPTVSDGYPLLSSFGSWDDHDARNVLPLVDDLANRLDTNGAHTHDQHLGTDVSVLLPALQSYLADKHLSTGFAATMTESPSFEHLLTWARRGDGVVLYLGFWEDQGAGKWVYVGGHYVAMAGVDPANRLVAISDPFRDAFEAGERALGRSPVAHGYPHAADVHNDAQYVSQDVYPVVVTEGPGGTLGLGDYAFMETFMNQNLAPAFQSYRDYYGGGEITTKLDYAIAICGSHMLYLPLILRRAR